MKRQPSILVLQVLIQRKTVWQFVISEGIGGERGGGEYHVLLTALQRLLQHLRI